MLVQKTQEKVIDLKTKGFSLLLEVHFHIFQIIAYLYSNLFYSLECKRVLLLDSR